MIVLSMNGFAVKRRQDGVNQIPDQPGRRLQVGVCQTTESLTDGKGKKSKDFGLNGP